MPVKHLVLLVDYADPAKRAWSDFSEAEQQQVMQSHGAFARAVAEREGCEILAAEALEDASASTVFRVRAGETVLTDGCYTESTEKVGGFYLMATPDLDGLVELLELMPAYVMEIRPVMEV